MAPNPLCWQRPAEVVEGITKPWSAFETRAWMKAWSHEQPTPKPTTTTKASAIFCWASSPKNCTFRVSCSDSTSSSLYKNGYCLARSFCMRQHGSACHEWPSTGLCTWTCVLRTLMCFWCLLWLDFLRMQQRTVAGPRGRRRSRHLRLPRWRRQQLVEYNPMTQPDDHAPSHKIVVKKQYGGLRNEGVEGRGEKVWGSRSRKTMPFM